MEGWSEGNRARLDVFLEAARRRGGRQVATFDADGTLWADDVGEDFFRWLIAEGRLPGVSPGEDRYAAYEAQLEVDTAGAYASVATSMAGLEEATLKGWCRDFFEARYAEKIFAPQAALVRSLEAAGVEVWVVTASPRWIVQAGMAWFELPPERVVGIDVAVIGGRLTDRVVGPVTYRAGKVAAIDLRIRQRPALASGNTMSDFDMLVAAGEGVVINPGEELGREAMVRRWMVQRFGEGVDG